MSPLCCVIACRAPTADPPRIDLGASGAARIRLLDGLEAHAPVEIGPLTLDAIRVGLPGHIEIPIELPASAQLRFAVGLPGSPRSPDMAVHFDLTLDGASLWTGQAAIGAPWQQVSLDLAEYAGQHGLLALSAYPIGDQDTAEAAFGIPELLGPPAAGGPRRIVVVGIDTFRPDMLGPEGEFPSLDRLGEASVRFTAAYAPAPRTRPSFRTSLSGRWPDAAIDAPGIGAVLGAEGFATAGIVANVHLRPAIGMAQGFDLWRYENGARAEDQVDRGLQWLESHATEDSLLFLHLIDPHIPYDAPPPFGGARSAGLDRGPLPMAFNQWAVFDLLAAGRLGEPQKAWIRARYQEELASVDHELGRLAVGIDALPGRSLLVLHSDHGEELWEHGGFEHNHALWQELVRVLCWFRPPAGQGVGEVSAPVGLVDLAATLYDLAGVPADHRPPTDGRSLAPFLQAGGGAPALTERPLLLGYRAIGPEIWGVVKGQGKYLLETGSGEERLYDLAADPHEAHDLSATTDLDPWRQALSTARGWPVRPGWRIRLHDLEMGFTLCFDAPLEGAGVIEPDLLAARRTNWELGERPAKIGADVATVELSEGGACLSVRPGISPRGVIWAAGVAPEAVALIRPWNQEDAMPIGAGSQAMDAQVEISAGAVLIPLSSEPELLEAHGRLAPSSAELPEEARAALEALGYLR